MRITTSDSAGDAGGSPPNKLPRTLRASGLMIMLLRRSMYLTRADFVMESHYAVVLAATARDCDRRLKQRTARAARAERDGAEGKLAGICEGTLAKAENGGRAFNLTFVIIALTLGVKISDIIEVTPDPAMDTPGEALQLTEFGIERIVAELDGLSPDHKVVEIRKMLDILRKS